MFMEDDAAAIDWHAKQLVGGRAVEMKPRRHMAAVCDDKISLEMQIGNIAVILFNQCRVAVHAKLAIVVDHIGSHKIGKLAPLARI